MNLYRNTLYVIRNTTRKTILAILAILVIGIPLLYLTVLNQKTVSAWFDEKWLYRIPVPISAHTAAENNVYITVTLDTATPITAGKMQADCGDLRFTKENGELLPYFINASPGCNNAATTVQVNFDSFPAGAQTIYYYYGNASAPNGFSSAAFATEATGATIGSLGSETQGPGPVGYWKFDDGQGTKAEDSSSSGNDGTISGSTWQPEDRCISGKCLFFDGSNDRVSVGDIDLPSTFTISAWIRTKSLADQYIVAKDNDTNRSYYFILESTGKLLGSVKNDGGTFTQYRTNSAPIAANSWYHVVITYDGSLGADEKMKFYVNGTKYSAAHLSTYDNGGTPESNSTSTTIGIFSDNSQGPFGGFIDDVKIFKYVRSAIQVKTDYQAGKANASANSGTSAVLGSQTQDFLSNGLVGYWKMDEAGIDAEGETSTDSSGNGNSGTLYGDNGAGDNGSGMDCTASGKFGSSCNFDGTDDYVSISNSALGTNASIGLWFNRSDTSDRIIISNSVDPDTYIDIQSNTAILVQTDTTGTYKSFTVPTMSTGTWYHLTVTRDNNTTRVYLNGTESTSGGQSQAGDINFNQIGQYYSGSGAYAPYQWNGKLDEIRIYNRTLSPAEIRQLADWAPGPVGYWDFEAGSGGSVTDKSGNANTGTWNGTGTKHWDTGKYGKGGNFASTTADFVAVTANSTLNFTGNFTVEAWVKLTATGLQAITSYGSGSQDYYTLYLQNNTVKLAAYNDTTQPVAAGATSINDGKWHHVAGVFQGTSGQYIYVDGKLDGSQTATTITAITTNAAYTTSIGQRVLNDQRLTGQIDEVKVYNYARTAKQIVADMNANHPNVGSPVGSAVGHWKFDEGQGITANNSGNGGSALNGTLTSMASPATATSGWTQAGKFGKGLIFDGSNDYVSTANYSASASTPITLSAWVSSTVTTNDTDGFYRRVVVVGGTLQPFAIVFKAGLPTCYYNGGTELSSTTTISTNTFYHVSCTYDGSTVTLYVNGTKVSSASGVSLDAVVANPIDIGIYGDHANGRWNGTIDDVKVYSYALTADEVKLDYNKGSSMVLGAAGNNSSYAAGAANQEYCIPGDSSTCTAPVGRWDFEEGSGGSVADTSGNGYTGSWNGTGTQHWTGGKYGKAGKFNGTDDYVSVPYNSSFDFGSGDFSVEFWLKMNVLPGDGYILTVNDCATDQTGWGQAIFETTSAGKLQTKAHPSNWMESANGVIIAGKWQHLALRRSGGNLYTYVNGTQVSTTTIEGALTNAGLYGVTMGARRCASPSNWINGQIDGLKIFNYARSVAQIAYDYNRGAPVGHWKFDECQGATVYDSSGNSYNGTITIGASGENTLGTCTTSSTAWGDGATGKRNASLKFDGTDDKVTIPAFSPGSEYSFSVWLNVNSLTGDYQTVINNNNSGGSWNGFVAQIESSTGKMYIGSSTTNRIYTSASNYITAGNWIHLVYTQSTTGSALYKNGVLTDSKATVTAPTFSGTWIAGVEIDLGATRYFNGQMDDMRIYNYALTAAQVKDIMNQGAVFFGPSTGSP